MPAIPRFTTERLLLTPVRLEDAAAYAVHFVDYEVIRHLSSRVPWPYPPTGVEDFLRDMVLPPQGVSRWTWAIRRKTEPTEIIGCIDLWREGCPEHRGFWVGRKFWGQGYMTEAVVPVLDYAFGPLGFESLCFSNALGNDRSRRIKEKTGATFIGLRPASLVDPTYTMAEVWSLTKQEWCKRSAQHNA